MAPDMFKTTVTRLRQRLAGAISNRFGPIDTVDGSLLHQAARRGDLELVRSLVERGADPKAGDENDWTPLEEAARNGHLEVVRFLVEHGARLRPVAPGSTLLPGSTPLHEAALGGHLDVVSFLVEHGADPNVLNIFRQTPLHFAAYYCALDVVRFLLRHGADPNAWDDKKMTPLDRACEIGSFRIVEELIWSGADPEGGGGDKLPCDIAAERGRDDIVEFLETIIEIWPR